MMVRMKVARSELTFSTPTLAKIAVSAAKTADSTAHTCHDEKAPAFIASSFARLCALIDRELSCKDQRQHQHRGPRLGEFAAALFWRRHHAARPDDAPAEPQQRQAALHRPVE